MNRSLLVLLLLPASLAAQMRSVRIDDRVRIYAPRAGYDRITGSVASTTPDVIGLKIDKLTPEIGIARDQIDQIFISIASRRNVAKGAFIGAILGGGGAFVFGPKSSSPQAPTIESGHGSTKNVVTGTLLGAGIGAFIGYYARSDTWLKVSPRALMP